MVIVDNEPQTDDPRSLRALHGAVLLGCVALLGFLVYGHRSGEPPATDLRSPLEALPEGASFVLTVDVERAKKRRIVQELGELFLPAPETSRVLHACGFDPLAQLHRIAFAVDSEKQSDQGVEFGIAATGDFPRERIETCAEALIRQRGGEPVKTPIGSFLAIRDRHESTGGEVAVRPDGVILLGGGHHLRLMIDAADARAPSLARDERHRALRLRAGADVVAIATWVPRPGWVRRMAGNARGPSPLESLKGAALAVDVVTDIHARLVLVCGQKAGCLVFERLANRLEAKLRLSGIEANLRTKWISDSELHVDATVDRRSFDRALRRESPPIGKVGGIVADELLRPRPADAGGVPPGAP